MRILQQSFAVVVTGSVLGGALNFASPRPVALGTPVYPASASGVAQCTDPDGGPHGKDDAPRTISLAEARGACDACSAGFVDARGTAAYAHGHITGAWHLPPEGHPDERATLAALRAFPTLVVYDQGGGCNLAAGTAARLRAAGLRDVRILDGSWSDWQGAGGPGQSGACNACEHGRPGASHP